MRDDAILTAGASPARRLFALGVLGALGALLLWLAVGTAGMAPLGRAAIAALGIGALAMAGWLQTATRTRLVLSEGELREEGGEVLTPLSAIGRSDRGPFANKPSAGFVLRLDRPVGPAAWRPGLWWRVGRRVGVGGVVAGHEARAMAEAIAAAVAERDA